MPIVIIALTTALFLLHKRLKKRNSPKQVHLVAHSDRVSSLPSYIKRVRRMNIMIRTSLLLLLIGMTGLLLLSARPSHRTVTKPVNKNRDIVLCLDVSGSMSEPNQQVAKVFKELAKGFDGERLGLIAFDNSPTTVFPLTDDYDYIVDKLDLIDKAYQAESIENADISFDDDASTYSLFDGTMEGEGSSIIGDGLAGCVMSFDKITSKRSRSIILVTDNQLAGEPIITLVEAGAFAKERDIRVYGINPADWSIEGGIYVQPEVVEFRQMTINTGGGYYRLDDASTVKLIIEQIDKQEVSRIDGSPQVVYTDIPQVFIIASFVTLSLVFAVAWRLRL